MTEKVKEMPASAASPLAGTSEHSWRDVGDEWRTHWRIGLASFLVLGLSYGAFQSISSLFVLPLQTQFGWSRAEVAYAHNAAIVMALFAPFVGRAADRFGARGIMLVGAALMALGYIGLSLMNGSLVIFYLLCAFTAVVGLSTSGVTCSRVVSQAFVRSRGLSLAIARSGMALATAVLPIAIYWAITHYGWRGGYVAQGLLILAIALPAIYFWIRQSRPAHGSAEAHHENVLPKWRHHLADRRVWLLCMGAGLGYAPATSIMAHLQPLLVSKGIGGTDAAALVGLAGIASFVGALITGSLVDRFWAPGIAFLFACGSAAGTCLLAMNGSVDGPVGPLAILLIGLGLGAEIDVVAYMVARYFGVKSFSTLYGLAAFFLTICGSTATSLMGIAFDKLGNYDLMLFIIAGAFMLAGCLYLLLGRYPSEQPA